MDDLVAFLEARLSEDERHACSLAEHYTPMSQGSGVGSSAAPGFGGGGGSGGFAGGGARGSGGSAASLPGAGGGGSSMATVVVGWTPERLLREIKAKRKIIDRHAADEYGMCEGCPNNGIGDEPSVPIGKCPELRILAAVWSGYPDYRQNWAL